MSDLSQAQLEELVNGKTRKPKAVFYEAARLDVMASKKAGRKVYKSRVFVKLTNPGVTDWTAEVARDHHIREYPREYQMFLANRQGTRKASVDIIPNLDITHLQELHDLGLETLEDLAGAPTIPNHLAYAQLAAIKLVKILKETESDQNVQKESNEEVRVEAVRADDQDTREVQDVSAADRQEHHGDDRRPAVSAGFVSPEFSISIG